MSASDEASARFPLLKTLKDLGKGGARIEASILTTYALNAVFYEEVLLRAFERAGSRLNILMVDASQLAATISDPLRRPQRAGRDYLLVPVTAPGAYHPKVLALLGSKTSIVAVGSHNATDPGFSRNEEVTGFWGSRSNGAPAAILEAALDYCLEGLRAGPGLQDPLLSDVQNRLLALAGTGAGPPDPEVTFIGSTPIGTTLWEQVSRVVQMPVSRVYVVGPYFDSELRMLKQIADDLAPAELIVGLQPDTAVLTNPEEAPPCARFVDSNALGTFWAGEGPIGFSHGKAVAFETPAGVVVTLGSANPTGAAWLDGGVRNAEANLLLTGATAAKAFETIGFHRLGAAVSLSGEQLASIADRSREVRRLERQRDVAHPSIPAVAGHRSGEQVFIANVAAADCRGATLLQADEIVLDAVFEPADGGVLLTTTPRLPSAGLVRIEGEHKPICMLILNDHSHLRGATRPKEAAQLLAGLGRLDDYEGFDELFDLFDRHIFANPGEGARGSSPTAQPAKPKPATAPDDGKPGPRGVSLLSLEQAETEKRILEGGLIADFIAALMRDLAPPPSPPPTDGDGRNLDSDDAGEGELAGEDLAATEEPKTSNADWPPLVAACRVRVGHLLGRLKTKLAEPDASAERAAWRFVRILTVLCLLQRLRIQPPPTGELSLRSDSLVTVDQLRKAFSLAVDAIYGPGLLAHTLEASPDHRGAQERQKMDYVLLWLGREIGADFSERAGFNESADHKARRLQNQADLVVIAMSAAGHTDNHADAVVERPAVLSRWADAVPVSLDWGPRHLALGQVLQSRFADGSFDSGKDQAKAGGFAIWRHEPGLPRLVRTLSGSRAMLIEPGGLAPDRPVAATWLGAIDAAAW